MYISSSIISQKPAIELHNKYWPHLQAEALAGKMESPAF
jgi:hypothetical protein